MTLVRTTTVMLAAGRTETAAEIATGTDTMILGMMTGATMIEGPGTTKGGINVSLNHEPLRGYNILYTSPSLNVHQPLERFVWTTI